MSSVDLWEQLITHEIRRRYVFNKPFVAISETDFAAFAPYFTKQRVVAWNNFDNLRTQDWYLHIHAVRQRPGEVNIHLDRFNPNTHWALNIPHGVVDVAPYFLWCLLNWRKPYTM